MAMRAMTWAPEGEKKKRKTWDEVEKHRGQQRGGDGGRGSWDEVRVAAVDREKWKGSVKAIGAAKHLEDG